MKAVKQPYFLIQLPKVQRVWKKKQKKHEETEQRETSFYFSFMHPPVLPLPTQPAGKVSKGDQVVTVLVEEGEGAVGQRVGVLVGDIGPRHQQPVQAFKLRSVQPILPFYKGAIRVTVVPRCCLCRRRRAAVPPVQSDEVLRLQGGGGQRKTK